MMHGDKKKKVHVGFQGV